MINTIQLNEEQKLIIKGLSANKKKLNPKYFYDQKGSELFDDITQLEEYYPTRTEIGIYKKFSKEIASYISPKAVVIEPGAGSCEKIEYLLNALQPEVYIPQDVSGDYLHKVVQRLAVKYPWLTISPIISDFSEPLIIPEHFHDSPKYVFYPGSTIGNFEPNDAIKFLKNMRKLVGQKGGMLLGADLDKNPAVLEAAYNDSKGVTAEFNKNILNNINSHLGSNFDLEKFEHKSIYNLELRRIEMHLMANESMNLNLLGTEVSLAKGETIHTENSYKYSLNDISAMAKKSGFKLVQTWLDEDKLFSVNIFQSI